MPSIIDQARFQPHFYLWKRYSEQICKYKTRFLKTAPLLSYRPGIYRTVQRKSVRTITWILRALENVWAIFSSYVNRFYRGYDMPYFWLCLITSCSCHPPRFTSPANCHLFSTDWCRRGVQKVAGVWNLLVSSNWPYVKGLFFTCYTFNSSSFISYFVHAILFIIHVYRVFFICYILISNIYRLLLACYTFHISELIGYSLHTIPLISFMFICYATCYTFYYLYYRILFA